MDKNYSFKFVLKRLYWDIIDKNERKYYLYWSIWQIPGLFGNLIRAKYLSNKFRKVGKNLTVLAGTRFRSMENLSVGDNVSIGYDNFIQALGGITIGNNVSTAPGVKIWSVNHNYKDKNLLIEAQGQTYDPVTIGNDVLIASNSFLLPGVIIPDGVVVAAGSVVGKKAYKPYSIIAGNPARVIGHRESSKISNNTAEKTQEQIHVAYENSAL